MAYQQPYSGGAPPPNQYGAPPVGHQPPYGQQFQYGQPPQNGVPFPEQAPYCQQPQYSHQPPYGQAAPATQQPPYEQAPLVYQQPPYGQQPLYGQAPPAGQQPVYGQLPTPYSAPPQQPYGGVPAPCGSPSNTAPSNIPTDLPTTGYALPRPPIHYDANADARALRKAMKGFGTDKAAIISILSTKDALQVEPLRAAYTQIHSRDLFGDIRSEVSGYLEEVLVGLLRGPLAQDCTVVKEAMEGQGTDEEALNDVLLGRSNADIASIKMIYQKAFHRSLEADLKSDLSKKTGRLFLMALSATRAESAAPVVPQAVEQDVLEIYKATEGKTGTDELLVCQIFSSRNDAQIGAISQLYEQKYRRALDSVIKSEFSGHMERALLHQLRTGTDRVLRDALLLEDAMAGIGTKDRLLLNRALRVHWDKTHLERVKTVYQTHFRKDLGAAIKSETSGDFRKALLAVIGE
ncbi:hypothetical protein V498_02416 [Pseudogymnoascus sp. VKM F-4517 (FW-2822)]|nr:hypothetical protein V498_02416 [Pseudogymnoascus sp. VKM F-4517 (FW-2822)]